MSVTLEVMLLVVAILVAVASIGVALAVRTSTRQRVRQSRHRQAAVKTGKPKAAPASKAKVTPVVMAKPATAANPEQAHQAKVAALQAMLALGDAKAKGTGKPGDDQFADTDATDQGYASTQFVDRSDPPTVQISLLNLDKVPAKRSRR